VATNLCLAVVHCSPGDFAVMRDRLRRLRSFYALLDPHICFERTDERAGLFVGCLALGGRYLPSRDLVCWGGALPQHLASPDALLEAGLHDLRGVDGPLAAFASAGGRARLVTAPSGPAALYAARSPSVEAWSTHAVAARWMAAGAVTLNASALAGLVAFEFVGGHDTLVDGATVVLPATVIDLSERGVAERRYWPDVERWAPLAEQDAQAHAERALTETLARRLEGQRLAQLALTGGADSRVTALALQQAGVPFEAFTWGQPGWDDVEGAARVARAIEVRHRTFEVTFLDDAGVERIHDRDARWCDGIAPLAPAERVLPADAGALIGGMAGETGRAFYYHQLRGQVRPEPPSHADLVAAMRPERRIAGATSSALASARAATDAWVTEARKVADGWRALDVVYAEQRVRRWGRAQIMAATPDFVAAFAPVEVARGLTSMSLPDRMSDAFHRTFVEKVRPDLALPIPEAPAVPVRLRRLRGTLGALRSRVTGRPPDRDCAWNATPRTLAWLTDEVLGHELVQTTLGPAWARQATRGVHAGHPHLTRQAEELAGPVRLSAALRQLR
jgi:hypothetical protein